MSAPSLYRQHSPTLVQVVDDDPITWLVIEKCAKKMGADSVSARSLQEARNQLDTHPIDIIVMDGWLPDGHGMELLEHVRTSIQYMDIPVIFCTADIATARSQELTGMGVEAVLEKPVQIDKLKDAMRAAIKKAPIRWEPSRVAADRLGLSQAEFDDLLRVVHDELKKLLVELNDCGDDPSGSDHLRAILFRVKSAALNVGAVRLAQTISLLNMQNLSVEEAKIAASMIRAEVNEGYGPFRSIRAS